MLSAKNALADAVLCSNRTSFSLSSQNAVRSFYAVSNNCFSTDEKPGLFEGQNRKINNKTEAPVSVPFHIDSCKKNGQERHFSTTRNAFSRHVDPKKNYYLILGVTPSCNANKVKKAYYRLSKLYHPDLNKTEEAVRKFHELTDAYEILSNSRLRQQYDDARMGHVHGGVYRGTAKHSHFSNFSGRGPPQRNKSPNENHDNWMKSHYTKSFNKNAEYNYYKTYDKFESQDEYYSEKGNEFKRNLNNKHTHNNQKNIVEMSDMMIILGAVGILAGFTVLMRR
ncbi:dnaJ homolog subfamily B member 9-like [Mya arenaria]|uniref:dnaJ homolog subfamily B member 9-like n=1 Tax=Mya arenaria TaxID=6604 RepID=UPI0022E959B6|nr:dnaJ homolog subfamily B member 9-like [Mya arenaria]